MKFLLVALCLIGVAHAGIVALAPSPYALPYAAPALAYAAPAPIAYYAPPVVAAPVIQPGYVAATRGSVHVAPLPGNTPYASHHLNLAPAPGTL